MTFVFYTSLLHRTFIFFCQEMIVTRFPFSISKNRINRNFKIFFGSHCLIYSFQNNLLSKTMLTHFLAIDLQSYFTRKLLTLCFTCFRHFHSHIRSKIDDSVIHQTQIYAKKTTTSHSNFGNSSAIHVKNRFRFFETL